MILIHIIFIKTMVSVWFDDVIHTISEGDSDLDGMMIVMVLKFKKIINKIILKSQGRNTKKHLV